MPVLEKDDLITVEDYLAGELVSDVKHEYLGGIVDAVAGGSANHSTLISNLTTCINSGLFGKSCRHLSSETKVRINLSNQTRFYYPDSSVACDSIDGDSQYLDNPTIVAEVLSPSTRRIDLGEKLEAYLAIPSLKVVLLLEPDFPHITLHRRSPNGGFTIEAYKSLDDFILLPEIEVELSVARLYDRITPSA